MGKQMVQEVPSSAPDNEAAYPDDVSSFDHQREQANFAKAIKASLTQNDEQIGSIRLVI